MNQTPLVESYEKKDTLLLGAVGNLCNVEIMVLRHLRIKDAHIAEVSGLLLFRHLTQYRVDGQEQSRV